MNKTCLWRIILKMLLQLYTNHKEFNEIKTLKFDFTRLLYGCEGLICEKLLSVSTTAEISTVDSLPISGANIGTPKLAPDASTPPAVSWLSIGYWSVVRSFKRSDAFTLFVNLLSELSPANLATI